MSEAIVADIGATHTRLGLWTGRQVESCVKLKTADYDSIPDALSDYLSKNNFGTVKNFAFAAAAAQFNDGIWRFTNLDKKSFSTQDIEKAGYRILAAENDFVATAYGCLGLAANDKNIIPVKAGEGRIDSARIVLGPGTGLGMAYGFQDKNKSIVRRTHGGHMLFTPINDTHAELSKRVAQKKTLDRPVIFEDMACGSSFPFLYEACCDVWGENPNKHFFDDVSQKSFKQALEIFHECLGLFTHTCVLTIHGYNGVVMNGGFLDALLERKLWNAAAYLKGFNQNGVPIVEEDLAKTPISIVSDTFISLYGLGKIIDA